jgi:hypothetical protein
MPEHIDDPGRRSEGAMPFPKSVLIAGITWIVWGCLIAANGALHLLVHVHEGAHVAGGMWNGVLGILFGAAFLFIGGFICKGMPKDTLGITVVSIAFGVLDCGYGTRLIGGGNAVQGGLGVEIVNNLLGLASLLCALGLLVAGVLALIGRQKYKDWRTANV